MVGQNHNFEGRGKEEESSNFTRAKIMKGSPFEGKKKKAECPINNVCIDSNGNDTLLDLRLNIIYYEN